MFQHLIRYGLLVLVASCAASSIVAAQAGAQSARMPVLPAIEAPPHSDFAPGVPRGGSPGVTPPQVINQVDPTYSNDAMLAGVQGVTVLDAVIGADGSVEQSRVRCSVHPSLDAQAQKAFSAWMFKPALLKGVPTRVVVEVQMQFRLHQEGEPRPLTAIPALNLKFKSAGTSVRPATGCTAPLASLK